jgi:hypothetical protein
MSIKNSNSLTGANNTGDGQSINIISGGSVNGKSGDVLISTKIADSANMTETGSIEINTGTIDGLLSPLSFTNTGNLLLKTGDNSGAENSTSGFIRLSTGLGGTGIGSGDLNLETGDNEAGTSGSGSINIKTGRGQNSLSGGIQISTGGSIGNADPSGDIDIFTGEPGISGGNSGNLSLSTGNSNIDSGNIVLNIGESTTGNVGRIYSISVIDGDTIVEAITYGQPQ